MLRPSDANKLMAVKLASENEYVPDIFFVERDKYGNQIKQNAKPLFPVEYLLVDLPAGANVSVWEVKLLQLVSVYEFVTQRLKMLLPHL